MYSVCAAICHMGSVVYSCTVCVTPVILHVIVCLFLEGMSMYMYARYVLPVGTNCTVRVEDT